MKRYSVITGDLVDSTKLSANDRKEIKKVIERVLKNYKDFSPFKKSKNYLWYRGDSFQLILTDARQALRATLKIRCAIRMLGLIANDARMVIGIGEVEQLTTQLNDSDGTAFRNSGRALEKLESQRKLYIKSTNSNLDESLNTHFYLLDELMYSWTANMAEAVFYTLKGSTQEEISKILGITQQAVNKRLKSSGSDAVLNLLKYYEKIIDSQQ